MASGSQALTAPRDTAAGGDEVDEPVVVDARPAPPQGIGGVTLAELWSGIVRYKPVAAAIGVILLAGIVLPGAVLLDDDGFSGAAPTRAPLVAASDASGLAVSADAAGDVTATTIDLAAPGVTALVDAAASSDLAFASAAATSEAASSASSSASTTTPSVSTPGDAPTTSAPAVALAPTYTVREAGWATAAATGPLASADVPEGGLPVGKRLGDVDKLSFVRLSGASKALVLKVADAPGGNRFTDQAKVQACRILDSKWQARPGMTLEEAPPFDRNSCAVAEPQEDGTWRFDLSRFNDATDLRGFALVPAPDAGTDFQVVFQPA